MVCFDHSIRGKVLALEELSLIAAYRILMFQREVERNLSHDAMAASSRSSITHARSVLSRTQSEPNMLNRPYFEENDVEAVILPGF